MATKREVNESKTYSARIRITKSALVFVTADSEDEARRKIKVGAWDGEPQDDELIDWSDPTELKEER